MKSGRLSFSLLKKTMETFKNFLKIIAEFYVLPLKMPFHVENCVMYSNSEWGLCVREVTWGETLHVLGCWEVPASRRRHLSVDGRVKTLQDLVLRVQAYEHPWRQSSSLVQTPESDTTAFTRDWLHDLGSTPLPLWVSVSMPVKWG